MNVDTLSIARELRAADLPPEQAEAIAAAIGRAVAESSATRGDIDSLIERIDAFDARLMAKVDTLDARLSAKIDSVESRLSGRIDTVEAQLSAKVDTVSSELTARIDTVNAELTARVDTVSSDLSAKIDQSRANPLTWVVGLIFAAAGAIVAVIKL